MRRGLTNTAKRSVLKVRKYKTGDVLITLLRRVRVTIVAVGKHFVLHILCVIGFGGLEVACWPLVPKLAGSNPAEAVGFLGRKNPQHAFLRRGSKAVGSMS